MDDFAFSSHLRRLDGISTTRETCVLAIGDVALWRDTKARLERSDEIRMADLAELTAATLAEVNPDLILSPVVAARFDCLDVASRLVALDFQGSYRAIARNLPDPKLVLAEVRANHPDLDFDIMLLPQLVGRSN